MKLVYVLFQLALTGYLFYALIKEPSPWNWGFFGMAVAFDIAMLGRALKSS